MLLFGALHWLNHSTKNKFQLLVLTCKILHVLALHNTPNLISLSNSLQSLVIWNSFSFLGNLNVPIYLDLHPCRLLPSLKIFSLLSPVVLPYLLNHCLNIPSFQRVSLMAISKENVYPLISFIAVTCFFHVRNYQNFKLHVADMNLGPQIKSKNHSSIFHKWMQFPSLFYFKIPFHLCISYDMRFQRQKGQKIVTNIALLNLMTLVYYKFFSLLL